jgi:hypothetical protein
MQLRKEIITHFAFLTSFLLFVTVFRSWFDIYYITFWIGGVVGTILPDFDQLVYVYLLKPTDLSSQRIGSLIQQKNLKAAMRVMATTRSERKHLIFHTVQFQLVFLALALLIITSTGNFLGRGIVLGVMLHLIIDQVVDLVETGNLDNWFSQLQVNLDPDQKKWYLGFNIAILLLFGFFL